MRVLTGFAMLIAVLALAPVFGDEPKSPYARVARGKPAAKDDVKVYTNEDLKRFIIVAPEDREGAPDDSATTPAKPTQARAQPEAKTADAPPKPVDALTRMRQRQAAQAEHRKAVRAAQDAVNQARLDLSNLESQLLAARNPFSARPKVGEEEKAKRLAGGETAAQRYERTQQRVEAARVALRGAEAELARLQAERP